MENRTPDNLKGTELRRNQGQDTWERARQRGLMEDCRTVHPVRYQPKTEGAQTAPPAQQTPLRQGAEPAPLPLMTPARTPGPYEASLQECDEKRLMTPLRIGTPIGPKGCQPGLDSMVQIEVEGSPTWGGRNSILTSTPQPARAGDFSLDVGDSGKVASKLFMEFIQRNPRQE